MAASRHAFGHDPALGGAEISPPEKDGPFLDESMVWEKNEDGAIVFNAFGLVAAADGSVLAFCEGRIGWQDYSPQHIFFKRSIDGGKTWSRNRTLLKSDGGVVFHNPTPVVDRSAGRIFLFFAECVENLRSRVLHLASDDNGATWSAPVDAGGVFGDDPARRAFHLPGCGHGIQTRGGRLILPVWHRHGIDNRFRPGPAERAYGSSFLLSDDRGATWRNTGWMPDSTESRVIELADGLLVHNARDDVNKGADMPDRVISESCDGGETWSRSFRFPLDRSFPTDSPSVAYDDETVLFARPDCPLDRRQGPGWGRRNLTVYASRDGFGSFYAQRVVDPGNACYSDLCVLPDKTILLLYGAGYFNNWFGLRGRCVRFNLAWIEAGENPET